MCGIFCIIHNGNVACEHLEPDEATHQLLVNRGVDYHSTHAYQESSFAIGFAGYVLWQQGSQPCYQPLIQDRFVLLMNGDIYSIRDNYDESDTLWLSKQLTQCTSISQILHLFQNIQGPYSAIFLDKDTHQLYFLRDLMGRQTLLLAAQNNGSIVISSVVAKNSSQIRACIEVPPLGLYQYDLKSQTLHLYPWITKNSSEFQQQLADLETIFQHSVLLEQSIEPLWLQVGDESLFSYNFETILDGMVKEGPEIIFKFLLENVSIANTCKNFIKLLTNSIQCRINATPKYCKHCIVDRLVCNHSRIGILFSGGVDCTLLARLADKLLDETEPIDLLNVSFEKVTRGIVKNINYNTPDRISARESLNELQALNGNRKWNLVEINITRDELNDALSQRIRNLVNPLRTILDESLGSVLWFASRGMGTCDGEPYSCPARVLLIGSGADELFGGYTRHRNAFVRVHAEALVTPYENLENELNFDFERLPSRNLARDDRVIGDFNITARSPYLEEEFIRFARNLKAFQKCYHALDQGVGDKLILRLSAYSIGLNGVASLRKRAMQFGSRIANNKQNAKDVSEALS